MKTKHIKPKTGKPKDKMSVDVSEKYFLRLYIAGQTSNALTAIKNLKSLCKEQLNGKHHIEIIDLLKRPQLGRDDQILAIPTLIRKSPPPVRLIIGDLSNTERVLVWLELKGHSVKA